VRTIICKKRGCGKRKPGNTYVVSEPGPDGILPLWTDIDPPIPYRGDQFRSFLLVDLELILAGASIEDYLVGASAERLTRENLLKPEIWTYGMPARTRARIGICTSGGLDALEKVDFLDVDDLGSSLRSLGRLELGKVAVEVPTAFGQIAKINPVGVLAALWRLWKDCPPMQREDARPWINCAMISLGALEDALEIAL